MIWGVSNAVCAWCVLCGLFTHCRALRARAGTGPIFAEHHIDAAMGKVRLMDLQETVQVCGWVVHIRSLLSQHLHAHAYMHAGMRTVRHTH